MSVEQKPLVNRVANSALITINLEDYFPTETMKKFDLKEFLFKGLILKEKDFREALKDHDWSQYSGSRLAVFCSADAIVPVWAYMLVATKARPFTENIFLGTQEELLQGHYARIIDSLEVAKYEGERIVIKGCSNKPVPASAYVALSAKLQPYAQSIMYGEPCSTVPIFKRPRKIK